MWWSRPNPVTTPRRRNTNNPEPSRTAQKNHGLCKRTGRFIGWLVLPFAFRQTAQRFIAWFGIRPAQLNQRGLLIELGSAFGAESLVLARIRIGGVGGQNIFAIRAAIGRFAVARRCALRRCVHGGLLHRGGLLRRGRRPRIGDSPDAFAEAFQSLAQSLTQLRQPPGAKQQKYHHRQQNQVPWLK